MKNAHEFTTDQRPDHMVNIQLMAATELALGVFLEKDSFDNWPTGLVSTWNECAQAGRFDECKTLGDMGRAFLAWRAADLDRIQGMGVVA